MKTMTVGEFKANFSDVLKSVQGGEKIAITYGKKKEVKAILIPSGEVKPKRKLGILKGKATATFIGDYHTSEKEFFGQ